MRVLYLGDTAPHSTSMHRANALTRIGHGVTVVNPQAFLKPSVLRNAFRHRTGYRFSRAPVEGGLLLDESTLGHDVVWVNGGKELAPAVVRHLRERNGPVVYYSNDNPTGGRDSRPWATYLEAIGEYDLVVVMREPNVSEAYARGARRVHRVWMSYDNVAHRPRDLVASERENWRSELLFVGTWMRERGPLLAHLIDAGVPLSIFGDRWQKAREWPVLKRAWRGGAVRGDDYAKAIQCARVSLGLLSIDNRDQHTQRSLEVPALGSLLCAQWTEEHAELYEDGGEAVLWTTMNDCVKKVHALLADEPRRQAVAVAGQQKVWASGLSNDEVVNDILDRLER